MYFQISKYSFLNPYSSIWSQGWTLAISVYYLRDEPLLLDNWLGQEILWKHALRNVQEAIATKLKL